jgi:hypothetical protein
MEGNTEVHFARISSGALYDAWGNRVDAWETPVGDSPIWRKAVSLPLSGGSAAAGWSLPAVGCAACLWVPVSRSIQRFGTTITVSLPRAVVSTHHLTMPSGSSAGVCPRCLMTQAMLLWSGRGEQSSLCRIKQNKFTTS